jgi:acyl-CoA hydrolase
VGYMDEAAAVAAIRYARGSVLTAHVDAIDFRTPVPIGCFLEAIVALPRFDGQLDYAA